jgi:hypothetical protein
MTNIKFSMTNSQSRRSKSQSIAWPTPLAERSEMPQAQKKTEKGLYTRPVQSYTSRLNELI